MKKNFVYPFTAVVGQEKIKKALILNIINPSIGGVLISGEKGTAKSTLVRGLAEVINNMKVINLPLNITEDRLLGTIDIEKAISEGVRKPDMGILKEADGNILYVDEVNLLSEHIVKCLLEVSASGINHVEREGISFTHSSRFVLVGTMNPEEGQLKSQFLDRFGLYVETSGSDDLDERKEIIKRRLEYEKNPIEYINNFENQSKELMNKIVKGIEVLNKVQVSESIMYLSAEISKEANCAGNRAEIVIIETAKAIAAFDNRKNVNVNDIKEAAEFALPHRMREVPPSVSDNEDTKEDSEEEIDDKKENDNEPPQTEEREDDNSFEDNNEKSNADEENDVSNEEDNLENEENLEESKNEGNDEFDNDVVDEIGNVFTIKSLDIKPIDRKNRRGSGKRSKTKTDLMQGRYVKYNLPKDKMKDIAFDATLRAAAPYQSLREKNGLAFVINKSDFREKVREKRTGTTILFVVDASGSMGAKKRMSAVKGAVVSLLTDAYEKRDKVGMIAFRKKQAEVLLGITRSVELAQKSLKDLPTGGKTPLSAGLFKGYEILKAAKKKDPEMVPVLVLVSDGRTNSSLNDGDPYEEAIEIANKIAAEKIQSIVIDTEQDFIKLGLAKNIAEAMNGQYYKLEELGDREIASTVRGCV
ncbi:MAG: magnesium chelatase subunit D family protein [Clostridium argentinense]|uniref:Magnesium chelatase subunit D family protein n=1 Tax=Clostridium faecium TaxID=2762223 RepID=A0ABR8YP89_9CLOT|nr:magnesium chelatase subunit D family protein [Clostridium faecium]MBD8046063.1 magnesium chelatase subunit D family protein [Clostridium faecium]MBS5822969.1 magnesium chelatase subunit D family protein [Clostridium argentinense]